jgi:glycerol kinase
MYFETKVNSKKKEWLTKKEEEKEKQEEKEEVPATTLDSYFIKNKIAES